jgi:hypothetical protein
MKYALVTFFVLFLTTFSASSILQTVQEEANPGTPVRITRLGPQPCPTCTQTRGSFTYNSGIADSLRIVIRDVKAWRKMWERIHTPFSPEPDLPEIDFSRQSVVVVALGTRPAGGYDIIVDRAYQRDDRLEIIVRKQTPGQTCFTTQAITQPVDIVLIPKTERSVVFRETEVVHECQ